MPRLQVELLVCPQPECRQIGANPSWQGLRGYCVGSVQKGTAHPKARMVPVSFSGKAPEPVEKSVKV
jgi:hypothetical protein